ncbi:MAG: sigma-70 family RNA polymerase sigma factor [Kofleriaceae bacterium]|nr:sigma-70 family RNA polymerase sigma factor [Myxococcales bacterium]MCB9562696.1 sigma-70 family RNA polymerase sigma factor [Kofleriaceae bacterium]MCB9571015.1 sigma-70 family RNA polymerase sigma factor [Kofleriaceae bacterium]
MSEDSDDLAKARQGDRDAFGALVRRYQRRVYATALHILGSHGDADDVTQETFVRAYRAIGQFDGRADFFTWLYRITVNTSLNHVRSGKRVAALAEAGATEADHAGGRPEALGAPQHTPLEWLTMTEDVRRVLETVAGLSETLRITLILATVEQLPYKQIAEILEVPEGTVAWRVNEARRLLRERLGVSSRPSERDAKASPDQPSPQAGRATPAKS